MSCAKNWLKHEDGKPDVAADILKVRQAKAQAIKTVERQQAAERKKKFSVKKVKGDSEFSKSHGKWQEEFRSYRQQQKTFSQWAAKNRLPVKLFGGRKNIHATWTSDLAYFQPLNVNVDSESYKLFDRCWNQYDDQGFGELSYKSFEALLEDIGYEFARPSWKQVDPMRTQKVGFQSALEWWGRNMDMADMVESQRVSPKKRKQASSVKKGKFVVDTKNEVNLLSGPAVKRARLNARKKRAVQTNSFREFRKSMKGTRNDRTIATITFKGKTTEFDITDYKPVDISQQQQTTVDLIWTQHDKNGSGSLSYDEFQKMMQNPQMFQKADCSFAKEGSVVKYDDFVQWWFSESDKEDADKQDEKEQDPPKREVERVNKILEHKGKAAAFKKKSKAKYATESAKFRKFRISPRKVHQKHESQWKVEISATKNGETKMFKYDLENYAPAFIPKGKEEELRHLNLIWKQFDKDGCGHLDAAQFQKVLSKVGLELTDQRTVSQLKGEGGQITFEKFSTWWFSTAHNDTAPLAPPAPEEKKQKVSAIRASDKHTAQKNMGKYKLAEDNDWAKMRYTAQQEARKRSAAFKKFRVENSPSPRKVHPDQFDIEMCTKDPALEVKGIALAY